jgi:hypothetical protein
MTSLEDGTKIYRSLGTREHFKEFEATLFNTEKGGMRIEVDSKTQPVAWTKQPVVFQSVTQWAMACAALVLGGEERHPVNGWRVCYAKAEGKRVYLHSFRKAEVKVKKEKEEVPEMPPKKLPKEPVAFEKSVLKSFPIIKKVYNESEKQPETLETDTQKLWKEVVDGKERFVCEQGLIFEIGMDGEPGDYVGTKQ